MIDSCHPSRLWRQEFQESQVYQGSRRIPCRPWGQRGPAVRECPPGSHPERPALPWAPVLPCFRGSRPVRCCRPCPSRQDRRCRGRPWVQVHLWGQENPGILEDLRAPEGPANRRHPCCPSGPAGPRVLGCQAGRDLRHHPEDHGDRGRQGIRLFLVHREDLVDLLGLGVQGDRLCLGNPLVDLVVLGDRAGLGLRAGLDLPAVRSRLLVQRGLRLLCRP